jgi:lipoate---protein ligase
LEEHMNIHDHLYEKITDGNNLLWELWEPGEYAVVIGYSQKAVREADVYACRQDGVPIIRRRGGGGAVVLLPGVLCITIAFKSSLSESPYHFFKVINQLLIDILETKYGVKNLDYTGISDIAIEDKKILGCSIFKSRDLFFYQGSLLVKPELHRINQYLRHPSKEPDYRNGRRHGDFITSLKQAGYDISLKDLEKNIFDEFKNGLRSLLQEE